VIEARLAVEQAIAALGPLAPIVLHTCVLDLPASAWGANGSPNGDAIGLLRYALSVLALHYSKARYPTASAEASAAPPAIQPRSSARASAALPAASGPA
jgi:hypothetical protein